MFATTKEPPLTQEFLLVAACSIWPPSERRNAAIEQAAIPALEWDRVIRVAARQRVIGLVHDGLNRARVAAPDAIKQAVSSAARAQLQMNLLFAAEVVRLHRAFETSKVHATFFKGIPAAIDIYGDIGIRHTKDLDILVSPDQISAASAILGASGYNRVDPPPSVEGARVRTLIRTGKDFIFVRKDDPSLEVELHWRLFNNAKFMEGLPHAADFRRYPALDGINLRTFVGDDLFAYLCAHGAVFAWARLKWLADIGALLARDPMRIEHLYRAAARRGAGRPAAQALLLCKRLLGSDVPEDLADEVSADPAVQRLYGLAITAMTRGGAEIEPYDLSGGLRPMARSPWLVGETPRFLWGEINTHWISWNDVINIPLPGALQFLYPILRVPIWLWRRMVKRKARAA
jgi:hypothetical protein